MKIFVFLSAFTFGLMACGQGKPGADNSTDKETSTVDTLATPGVIEYLGVPGPIHVGEYDFHLGWSSNPSENYFKQEYFPLGNMPEKYNQMVMVELAMGDLNAKDLIASKIQETEGRKPADYLAKATASTDPKSGAEVLEFMWSHNEGLDDGIVEWNVYRYIPYTDADGKKGIELFGFSKRGYGMKTEPFVGDIQRNSEKFKAEFLAVPAPALKLKK